MTSAMSDINSAVFHVIDKSVFLVGFPDELALQISFERFRLANTFKASVALYVFD